MFVLNVLFLGHKLSNKNKSDFLSFQTKSAMRRVSVLTFNQRLVHYRAFRDKVFCNKYKKDIIPVVSVVVDVSSVDVASFVFPMNFVVVISVVGSCVVVDISSSL